jgi:aspartate kinase
VVPSAQKLDTLSFEEMQELAAAGAKVLNAQAVEFAREKGIVIHARSTHGAGTGTAITAQGSSARKVKGVTAERDVWLFAVAGRPEPLLELLDAQAVKGRHVIFDEKGRTLVVVPLQDVHGPEALRAKLPAGVEVLADHGTVTCVGTGLSADWSVVRSALAAAASEGVKVAAVYSSALQVTLVAPRAALDALTRALHVALVG